MPYMKHGVNSAVSGEQPIKLKAVKILGTTGYQKEAWIKEEEQADGFSIISNYSDEELLNLGVSQDLVNGRTQVNMYDKIVVPN